MPREPQERRELEMVRPAELIQIPELQHMFNLKAQGRCPFCGKEVNPMEFRDEISWREFEISGLCQRCQDDFFGKEDE
jgi:hypothetical protein